MSDRGERDALRDEIKARLSPQALFWALGEPPKGRSPRPGGWVTVRCPLPGHDDSTPSCSLGDRKWRCHGCGARGDVFDLMMGAFGVGDWEEALDLGASLAGLEGPGAPPRPRPRGAASRPAPAPRGRAAASPEVWSFALAGLRWPAWAGEWLERRGIGAQLARALGVRAAADRDWAARVEAARAAFGGRAVREAGLVSAEGAPHPYLGRAIVFVYGAGGAVESLRFRQLEPRERYGGAKVVGLVGSRNAPRTPYLSAGRSARALDPGGASRDLYVCEGEIDALSLRAIGRAAIGVPGGRAWSESWWTELAAYGRVIAVADGDASGAEMIGSIQASALSALGERWRDERLVCAVMDLGGMDCNDLLRGGELEAWCEALEAGRGA